MAKLKNTDIYGDLTLYADLTTATDTFFVDGSTGQVGIGTSTIPHGSIGAAKLAIEGANASTDGPHIQLTTASDDYPLLQNLAWAHDSVHISFDSYYDGSNWKSSDAGSNFKISKTNDRLSFGYDSGIAQGSNISFNNYGLVLDTSGKVGVGTNAPDGKLHIYTGNAGSVTADALANDLIIENSANTGLSIISPDASYGTILFGTTSEPRGGEIIWDYDAETNGILYVGGYKSGSQTNIISSGTFTIRCTADNKVGIGTTSVPHGSIGAAKLAIEGTDSSIDGPHIQFTTNSDNYPLLQNLAWTHDSVHISFDSYYDGSHWKSSYAGSNFKISKTDDKLSFGYDSGIAQGSNISFNDYGLVLNTSGHVGINNDSPSSELDVDGDVEITGSLELTGLSADETEETILVLGTDNLVYTREETEAINPARISGLVRWYKADAISGSYADGEDVGSWTDSSSTNDPAVSAAGTDPPVFKENIINGYPIIRFNANSRLDFTRVTDCQTIFIVSSKDAVTNKNVILWNSGDGSTYIAESASSTTGGPYYSTGAGGANGAGAGSAPVTQMKVTSLSFLYYNTVYYSRMASLGLSEAWNLDAPGQVEFDTIGYYSDFNYYLDGDVAEILIYNRKLAEWEVDQVEGYLAAKYEILNYVSAVNDGIDGSSGTSGADGTSGTSGADGTSGTSGADGTSGTSGSSGLTGLNTSREFTASQTIDEETLTIAASAIAWDVQDKQCARVTLNSNATLSAPSNEKQGGVYVLRSIQAPSGSGPYTLSYNTAYSFEDDIAPDMPIGYDEELIIVFYCAGSNDMRAVDFWGD